jgi:hypothetical protein
MSYTGWEWDWQWRGKDTGKYGNRGARARANTGIEDEETTSRKKDKGFRVWVEGDERRAGSPKSCLQKWRSTTPNSMRRWQLWTGTVA